MRLKKREKKSKSKKISWRNRVADWLISPGGKWRQKLKIEHRQQLREIVLNPVAWFRGVDLPEGHVTPWELFLFALSAALAHINNGLSGKQDFLYKEYYRIAPNKISVGSVISSLWDAANDPVLGTYMDRKRWGPREWRIIMRISAVTGHTLNVIKLLDGGMSDWQHIVVLVACNCIQDIIGTMDAVAGQKMRAGISPYSQQRARTQVWSSVGSSIGYPLSMIPNLLMGFKDILGLNDYQIIVVGAICVLPMNIISSFLLSFMKQRVSFRPGAPINSLPDDPSHITPLQDEMPPQPTESVEEERERIRQTLRKKLDEKEKCQQEQDMTAKERRARRREEKRIHREKFKRGEYEIDPNTGEPKLTILESFAVTKYNKYFIANTIAGFITVFTPTVDELLIFRYLVPKLKFFGNELGGEVLLQLKWQIAGTFVTFSKPFSRQMVNLIGGPLKTHKLNNLLIIVANFLFFLIGANKLWKIFLITIIQALLNVVADMDAVAGSLLTYEMLDYVELKTGLRTEGVTTAVSALITKIVSNNIGTLTGNAFLEWTGYTGGYDETGEALPPRFVKYMWPMFTLATVFDNFVYLIARSFIKYSPEDSDRVEALLKERRAAKDREKQEADEVSVGADQTGQ